MSRCRFLVDECLPNSLAEGLRRHIAGVDVRGTRKTGRTVKV